MLMFINTANNKSCRFSITGPPSLIKVSPGRQFTGKSDRAERIFAVNCRPGGDFSDGGNLIMGRLFMGTAAIF